MSQKFVFAALGSRVVIHFSPWPATSIEILASSTSIVVGKFPPDYEEHNSLDPFSLSLSGTSRRALLNLWESTASTYTAGSKQRGVPILCARSVRICVVLRRFTAAVISNVPFFEASETSLREGRSSLYKEHIVATNGFWNGHSAPLLHRARARARTRVRARALVRRNI